MTQAPTSWGAHESDAKVPHYNQRVKIILKYIVKNIKLLIFFLLICFLSLLLIKNNNNNM